MESSTPLLGGRSPSEFLREYWQKQPLLIRAAIPGFHSPLTPDELAGLACDADVASRLVRHRLGDASWEVRYGPFSAADFSIMPETHWSLLISDAEKVVPQLHTLLEPFRFIPDWRIDDLMISYAAPQGSVGPHVDQYDVFLLQAMGSRRWEIGPRQFEEGEILPDSELRILREFRPDRSWVLKPGDMLYLPPGFPHHGVALEAAMTYSIGFRAPAHSELMTAWFEHVLEHIPTDARYEDPGLVSQTCPGEISAAALQQIREILQHYLSQADDAAYGWFGRLITEPQHDLPCPDAHQIPDAEELQRRIRRGANMKRHPYARLAYVREKKTVHLFAAGVEYQIHVKLIEFIELLTRNTRLNRQMLEAFLQQPAIVDMLIGLLRQGVLAFDDE